jgi:hypothetical protein
MDMDIKELKFGDLHIKVSREGEELTLNWEGAIYSQNPREKLEPYCNEVIDFAKKENLKIICIYTHLDYLNSTSILSLIQFIKMFSEKEVFGEFIYDQKREVQVASFRALDVIAKRTKFVTIKAS